MSVSIFSVLIVGATLLTALVAGLLLTFAIITMPGIGKLGDREFVRAFQVMDRIIQKNHPLFILTWAGSVLLLLGSVFLGIGVLPPALWSALIVATVAYFVGVQLPTLVINVPLNNALQEVDAQLASLEAVQAARRDFEAKWNRWNRRRTVVATAVTVVLLLLLLTVG
jgi:uncharacterized membrane protein